jgi:apolipoprotein D and lipocalin family protein
MKSFLVIILVLSTSLSFAVSRAPLDTVDYVDIDRYAGKWYEIARFDQKFQRGCTAVTAEYIKNGKELKVINSCRLGSPEGKLKKGIARAWVVDRNTNAKLKVQFFLRRFRIPFLAGNYWIIDLDENYTRAMIGDPSRKYLWFLSRDKELDEATYLEMIQKAETLGFDTRKLLKTVH